MVCAAHAGHLEMVKFLLEAGADQEHKTDEMHTALMEASMDGHVEVARLLLDSGAQVGVRRGRRIVWCLLRGGWERRAVSSGKRRDEKDRNQTCSFVRVGGSRPSIRMHQHHNVE